MDLKIYYQKIREMEGKLVDQFPVVVSCETSDGGKVGVCTEVPRGIAAKMLVEGAARLATAEESNGFRRKQAEAKRAHDDAEAARAMQIRLVSLEDARKLTGNQKGSQDRG